MGGLRCTLRLLGTTWGLWNGCWSLEQNWNLKLFHYAARHDSIKAMRALIKKGSELVF